MISGVSVILQEVYPCWLLSADQQPTRGVHHITDIKHDLNEFNPNVLLSIV